MQKERVNNMNGVKEDYSIKVKQTAKGVWYCDGLQVISESTTGLSTELNHIMTQVEQVLYEHNEPDEPNEWEKAAKRVAEARGLKQKKPVDVGGEK